MQTIWFDQKFIFRFNRIKKGYSVIELELIGFLNIRLKLDTQVY